MADDADMREQLAWMKEQMSIHVKNGEDALKRMAQASQDMAAHGELVKSFERRLDALEKQMGKEAHGS